MATILVTDYDFPDLSIERAVLEDTGVGLRATQAETEEELIDAIEEYDADGLLNQHASVGRAVLEAHPDLQAVGRYGIGVDTIDLDVATEHQVYALNVPDYCLDEVPTHAMSLILSVERRTAMYTDQIRDGTWDWKQGQPIYRLRGRTLGLVGFGKLPRHLVPKADAFGLALIAYDPYVDEETMENAGVEKVTFGELLERSDIISVHVPLTDDTRNLFDSETFELMNDETTIINTSRGAVIDVDALHEAIDGGEIRGAGIDVMPDEPPEYHPLFDHDSVVLSPHVAWYSEQSIVDMRRTITEDVLRVLQGGEPKNPVNELE